MVLDRLRVLPPVQVPVNVRREQDGSRIVRVRCDCRRPFPSRANGVVDLDVDGTRESYQTLELP